jgi:hypothetical protein
MVTKAEQREIADREFREKLAIINLRVYPPITLKEGRWQVKRLRALADKRELEMAQ